MYRFEDTRGQLAGEDLWALEGLEGAQALAAARAVGASDYPSLRAFTEAMAEDLDEDPDTVCAELWDLYECEAAEPSYTLVYFWWCDGGELFPAASATPTGVRLWQEGFKAEASTPLDLAALDAAWRSREH